MKRLDTALVELGLAPSRTKAQRMIEAGEIEVQITNVWKSIQQPSFSLKSGQAVRAKEDSQTLKYVSRGGLKLEGALMHLKLNVQGFKCLDIGLSTGGFADCLLQHGASQVIGVDVGHGQLSGKLKTEAKLNQFEGLNVRDLPSSAEVAALLNGGLDLCVVDVAFISLKHVFPVLQEILPGQTRLLALVKPQFEVGAQNLDKNGIVQDHKLFAEVEAQTLRALEKCGFSSLEYFASEVKGQDGNQEFFVFAIHA